MNTRNLVILVAQPVRDHYKAYKAIDNVYRDLLTAPDSISRHKACRELEQLVRERNQQEGASL